MIKIEVDESYAFDFISILEIKYEHTNNQKILEQCVKEKEIISEQIGQFKFDTIMKSDEYYQLKKQNAYTFECVDRAKTDKILASEVDYSNLLRFNARKNLQDKFFDTKNSEIKIGYEIFNGKEK